MREQKKGSKMLFDENRPVRKPASVWELKKVLEAKDERRKELAWHRSECAGGNFVWNNDEAKKEFYDLGGKRKRVLSKLATAMLD